MTIKTVTLRADDRTIVDHAVDLAVEVAAQLRQEECGQFDAALRAVGLDTRSANRIQDACNDLCPSTMDMSTRIGFCLGVTLATQGPLSDKVWAAEAMRLSGESAVVKVRPTA